MSESGMIDGADKRKRRVLDLLQEMKHQDGMTTLEAQGFMMNKFGLKFDTTQKYLREMHLAGMIKDAGRKWKAIGRPLEE